MFYIFVEQNVTDQDKSIILSKNFQRYLTSGIGY